MGTRKYFVYNEARESFLSECVTVIDTSLEPLKLLRVMVEGLALNASTGLWLTPLTEIPKVPRLSPFDLIYLDADGRVMQGAELLPGVDFPAFKDRAASALVLPLKTHVFVKNAARGSTRHGGGRGTGGRGGGG